MSSVSNSGVRSLGCFSAKDRLLTGRRPSREFGDDAQQTVRPLAVCPLVKAVPVKQEAVLWSKSVAVDWEQQRAALSDM